jgi:ribosomal protein S25
MDKDTFIISEKTGETIKERCNSGKQLAPAEEKPKVTIAKVEPDQSATLPFEAEKPKETRVAEEKPVIPSRTVDKEKFDKVVQKIKAGKVTIEYLRDNYILTPEVAKEILAALDSENINNE